MVWPSMPQTANTSPRTATICTTLTVVIAQSWSPQSPLPTAPACTAFSPMRTSATCSGTAGTASPPGISALPDWPTIAMPASACGPIRFPSARTKVANGFSCPAAGELANAGSFSRHAHPEDCRKYYICLEGVAREYGCPIGTVFKIGDSDGTGNCEDPEDVPGCEDYYGDLDLKSIRKSELLAGLNSEGRTKGAPKTKAASSS
ncbi:uncharacterized protein Gasp isoform X2 [Drosophila bipectinata]|uniref:uncharacterized protein Gasp isoform X2 n=1 Tax=Drosophila bipectinata TaxID=42026 RepID=UPI0038B3BDBF